MTPAQLVGLAAADGVALSLTPSGKLRLTGNEAAVFRWLAVVGVQYAAAIVAELSAGVEIGALAPQCPAAGASVSTASADAPGGLP